MIEVYLSMFTSFKFSFICCFFLLCWYSHATVMFCLRFQSIIVIDDPNYVFIQLSTTETVLNPFSLNITCAYSFDCFVFLLKLFPANTRRDLDVALNHIHIFRISNFAQMFVPTQLRSDQNQRFLNTLDVRWTSKWVIVWVIY